VLLVVDESFASSIVEGSLSAFSLQLSEAQEPTPVLGLLTGPLAMLWLAHAPVAFWTTLLVMLSLGTWFFTSGDRLRMFWSLVASGAGRDSAAASTNSVATTTFEAAPVTHRPFMLAGSDRRRILRATRRRGRPARRPTEATAAVGGCGLRVAPNGRRVAPNGRRDPSACGLCVARGRSRRRRLSRGGERAADSSGCSQGVRSAVLSGCSQGVRSAGAASRSAVVCAVQPAHVVIEGRAARFACLQLERAERVWVCRGDRLA
jgi:hypothetical protein